MGRRLATLMLRISVLAAAAALCVFAAACGGDDGGSATVTPTPSPVPTPADVPSFSFFGNGPTGLLFKTQDPFSVTFIGDGITAQNTTVFIHRDVSPSPGLQLEPTATLTLSKVEGLPEGGIPIPGSLAPLPVGKALSWTLDLGPGDYVMELDTPSDVYWQGIVMSPSLVIPLE